MTSNAATLTVGQGFGFTSQPQNAEGAVGDKVPFKVAATGDGLTYRWYLCVPGSEDWKTTTIAGYKTDTLTVTVQAKYDGYKFRCVVTNADGDTITSDAATFTLKQAASSVAITTQPANASAAAGANATFSVKATGDGLTYQWQYQTASGTKWNKVGTSIASATTANLVVSAATKYNGYKYRCVVTDANGKSVTSDYATLTVTAGTSTGIKITKQPQNIVGASSSKVDLTVTATGTGLSYQWQHSTDSGATWTNSGYTGNKTAAMTITINATSTKRIFRCVITDGSGNTATTNTVTVAIGGGSSSSAVSITTQPSDVTVAAGATAKFTVVASGPSLTYQWTYSKTGSTWYNVGTSISGAKTATMSFASTTKYNGYQYKCVVTDVSGNSVTSNPAKLTVKSASTGIKITTQPQNVVGAKSTKTDLTVAATGTDLTYQWQHSTDNGTTWTNSTYSGAKTNAMTITINATSAKRIFRCVITDGSGNTAITNTITVTIGEALGIKTQPSDVSVSAKSTATFKVVATGNDLTYRWQYSKNGTSWTNVGTSINGYNAATMSFSAAAKYTGYKYRCVVTDGAGNKINSDAATLTVK